MKILTRIYYIFLSLLLILLLSNCNPSNSEALTITYRLTEPMNWIDAEAQAIAWGGHLVTIESWEEELLLKNAFGVNELFWIGLNDIDEENVWVWSSGNPVIYTNWAIGEPNDCGGDSGICESEDGAAINWCLDGSDPCFGDYWNDLSIDGNLKGIAEIINYKDKNNY